MTETNAIPYLNQLVQYSEQLGGLPALPLVFLVCLMAGYLFAAIPVYKNQWIPLGVFITGLIFNLAITPIPTFQAGCRLAGLGLLAGGAAWFVHKKIMSRWIDVSAFKNGETDQIPKPSTESWPKPPTE